MVIYRVQTTDNYGPYTGSYGHWNWSDRCHNNSLTHPSPQEDGMELDIGKHFGFRSKKQLKAWFDKEERQNLQDLGYIIVKGYINKKHVNFGNRQISFDYDQLERTSYIELNQI